MDRRQVKAGFAAVLWFVAATLTAATVVISYLDNANRWKPPDWFFWVGLTILVLCAFAPLAWKGIQAIRAPGVEERRQLLEATVNELYYYAIPTATGMDLRDIGVAVYRVAWRPGPNRLQRVIRERAKQRYNTSGIKWTVGKGVIGQTAEDGEFIAADLDVLWGPHQDCTSVEWGAVEPGVRMNLTHDEFRRVLEKQGAVAALPIISSTPGAGRTIGVIAIDGPSGSAGLLGTQAVADALTTAATVLGDHPRLLAGS